jgi:hypothetical protein
MSLSSLYVSDKDLSHHC